MKMLMYKRLYSPDASAIVREGLTAIDAATWTPDSETGPAVQATTLDAREWESVRVTPVFTDGAGAIVDGTSVDLVPLVRVPTPEGIGHVWRELPAIGVTTDDELVEVPVDGHFVAFRLTALTLGTATDVSVRVTGGAKRRNIAGG